MNILAAVLVLAVTALLMGGVVFVIYLLIHEERQTSFLAWIVRGAGSSVGALLGASLIGGTGGAVFGFAGLGLPRGLAIIAALVGAAVWYPIVSRWLSQIDALKPLVRWLFPYEGWGIPSDDVAKQEGERGAGGS